MNDTTVLFLSAALLVSVIFNAVLSLILPTLVWKQMKQEQRLDKLDEALAEFMEAAGVPKASP